MLSQNSEITKRHIAKLVSLIDGHPMMANDITTHFPKTILTVIYRYAVESGISIRRTRVSTHKTGRNLIYYLDKDSNIAFEMVTQKFGRVDWKNFGGAILNGNLPDYREANKKLQIFIQTIRRCDKYAKIHR
jgi:hypothetical protein